MPNNRVIESIYLGPFQNVEAVNTATLYKPGELGARFISSEVGPGFKEYQLVQMDSGATAATPTGAPAVGQVCYWKSRTSYIVTNDSRFSEWASQGTRQAVNDVACVAKVAVTPGNYFWGQLKGQCSTLANGTSFVASDFAIPFNSATSPFVDRVAVGSNYADTLMGRSLGVVANGLVNIDLQLPGIP